MVLLPIRSQQCARRQCPGRPRRSAHKRRFILARKELEHSSPLMIYIFPSAALCCTVEQFKTGSSNSTTHESIRNFNDWIFVAATRQQSTTNVTGVERVYRDLLPDHGNVFFTHGDLTLGNIILSTTIPGSPTKIAGIIDWEQAGWYPEYWEYCKLLYGVEYDHEWRADGWANRLMKQFEDEWFAIAEYSLWRCP